MLIPYNDLRKTLIKDFQYTASTGNAFCLISPERIPIDLLPFGEIEYADALNVEGVGLTSVKLDGFKEVFERGTMEVKIGSETYRSCSIPGIVILKMIAYDDRPGRRGKDIEDINAICQHYPTIEDEHIWVNHSDLYDDELDHFDVGMIVLGREMSRMISDNKNLRKRIFEILNKAINLETDFISVMIKDPLKETIDQKRNILTNILRGLTEGDS
jgi:predicted nucleotidyltransferase